MSHSAPININTDEAAPLIPASDNKLHLFKEMVSSTKSITVNLYSKFNFRSTVLEENFKKLNNKTEPYVENVTSFLDCGLNNVIKTITPITSSVSKAKNVIVQQTSDSKRKVGELVSKVSESGKSTQIFKKAEQLSIEILNHLQRDVSELESKVNGFKKSKNLDEESQVSGLQEKIDREEPGNIGLRVKQLTKQINTISQTMADSSLEFIDASAPVQKIKKAYAYAAVPVKESLIFSKVLRDYMLEHYMVPVYKVATLQYDEGKKFIKLTISSPKQTFTETVWPSVTNACTYVKASTVVLSNNTAKFLFDKTYFQENSQKIIAEITHIKETVMKSHIIAREQASATYTAALKEFKQRREHYVNKPNEIEFVSISNVSETQTNLNLINDNEASSDLNRQSDYRPNNEQSNDGAVGNDEL